MLAHLPAKWNWVSLRMTSVLHSPWIRMQRVRLQGLIPFSRYRQDPDTSQANIHIIFIKEDSGTLPKTRYSSDQKQHMQGERQHRESEGKLPVTASRVPGQQSSFHRGQLINGRGERTETMGMHTICSLQIQLHMPATAKPLTRTEQIRPNPLLKLPTKVFRYIATHVYARPKSWSGDLYSISQHLAVCTQGLRKH